MSEKYPVYDQNAVLAKNVKRLREERGWTVKELAKECSFTELLVNDIEKGVANVDVVAIVVLARAFHVPAPSLIIWKDDVARMKKDAEAK